MKRDLTKYLYTVGLIALIIQFLILVNNVLSGTLFTEEIISSVTNLTFTGFIKMTWAGLLGTVILILVFFRKLKKGNDFFLDLTGIVLWIVQIYLLYEKGMNIPSFLFAYIIGILGILILIVTVLIDFIKDKKNNS